MTNLQAINLLKGLEQSLDDYCELNDEGKTAFRMAITALELFGNSEQLPSAQPDVPDTTFGNMISRQAAIDALHGYFDGMLETDTWSPCDVYGLIEILPSAQPDTTTHDSIPAETGKNDGDRTSGDCISRQAVTKFLNDWLSCLFENCHKQSASDLKMIIKDFKNLPSAQPECDDTVSRKAEIDAIKRYIRGFDAIDVNFLDGLKTAIQIIEQLPHEYSNAQNTLQRVGSVECEDTVSRQAAIKAFKNFLTIHDSRGVEYLCSAVTMDGVNKILSDLPSAQPDIIHCKDCKHWMPYDWMFSEVWQSVSMDDYSDDEIGCAYCDMNMHEDDFCSRAERRTDE